MHRHLLLSALMTVALAACSSPEDVLPATAPVSKAALVPVVAPAVASVLLVTSSATIPSEGQVPAEITAYVRDSGNQFVANVPVSFSANSGGLTVVQGVTDANGVARARLSSAGDPTGRAVTVTAVAGSQSSSLSVSVAGSALTLQGPSTLSLNQRGTYRVALVDSANHPIVGRTINIVSQRANALSGNTVVTDVTGSATFVLTAINGSNDTLTISGLGIIATQSIAVSADSFTFVSPATGMEVGLSPSTQNVSVAWMVNGSPVAGQPITFSTTRGTLGATTMNTNGNGVASTTVSATSAGGAVVTAAGGTSSASVSLEFVAATPVLVDLQPSVSTIGPAQSSTLTATIRDWAGNPVKNKTVVFTLNDATGGTLSVGSATTSSQGRAQTVYTAGNTTSASEGVKITASVQGFYGVTPKQVALTVARRERLISLGSNNEIIASDNGQYAVDHVVQVTDASGRGVAGVAVKFRVLSRRYYKGFRVAGPNGWSTSYTVAAGCSDEDLDRNGVLTLDEDFNSNAHLEAGNIASVSPAGGFTDANGFLVTRVEYPREYAGYLTAVLIASATVSGTEYVRTNAFMLAGRPDDFSDLLATPPGPVSPFGTASVCTNPG